MKIKKSLLLVCLSILLMFGCLVPSTSVYASSGTGSVIDRFNQKLHDISQDLTGTIYAPIGGAIDGFKQWINNHKSSYGLSNDEDADDLISGGYQYNETTNDNSISVDLSNAIIDYTNNYLTDNYDFIYAYSYSTIEFLTFFRDQTAYHAFSEFVNEHTDSSHLVLANKNYFAQTSFSVLVVEYNGLYGTKWGNNYASVTICNNWLSSASDLNTKVYQYNNGSFSLINENTFANLGSNGSVHIKLYESVASIDSGYLTIITPSVQTFTIYKNLSALQYGSEGVKGYYVSDSYNNYSHVNNTQIINDNSFVNTPTYGDVNSYINNYYTNNNNYPTINQITQYINNYEGGGGGSGSDDDDDDDAESGFIELIKKFLHFISQLLDTIAGFLADLVDSLGDVVNSVVNNILSLVTNIKDNLPNAIGGLLEYFLPFFPSEILNLVKASILLSVIVGLIRLIRGR